MIKSNSLQLIETETFTVLGINIQFLTTPEQIRDDISILRTTVPPGAVIPLHSHPDPEIFYVLDGSLEVFQAMDGCGVWRKVKSGEISSIAGGTKHALRNPSDQPVLSLVVTKRELYCFFRELARSLSQAQQSGPPSSEEMRALFAVAGKYRYWLATSEENAAIGVSLGSTEEP